MYSVNVPVPTEVARLAAGLATTCRTAETRTRHTLVVKRLGDRVDSTINRQVRAAIEGTAPFAARVSTLEVFEEPASGPAPVVYLAVESPGLSALHDRLCARFEPVPGLEGSAYVPHVTVARGGDAGRLLDTAVEPIDWTVERLVTWDGTYAEPVETVALPA